MNKRRKRLNGFGYSTGDRFVMLHFWLLKSVAWDSLSPHGSRLLVEMMTRYNGMNNGEIWFSHREAAHKLGVGKNMPAKIFRELEDLGFIKVRQLGSFDWKVRHATTWELTIFDCDGHQATKDFMRVGREEVQMPVPRTGTDSPSARDRREQTLTQNADHGPCTVDRQTGLRPFGGPSEGGTSNIPGRGAKSLSTTNAATHSYQPSSVSEAEEFGRAVKSAREGHRWSQGYLARKVGISRSHLANIEAGRFGSEEVRANLARKLGFTSEMLRMKGANEGAG